MKKETTVFAALLYLSCILSCDTKKIEDSEVRQSANFSTIAFGSCNKHNLPQPLWKPILEEEPDLWIWLGDNVYGDTPDMDLLESKYELQYNQEDYVKIRQNMKVIGIWDDHDYGINDGGVNYAQKGDSQQLMLDFLDEPENSDRRNRKGAYAAYTFGEGDQKVNIYLLDARYHRDTLLKVDGSYIPNLEGTVLGEEQWTWLETELISTDAAINIIASGIQFIADEHAFEKWANFPNERERLMNLIADSGINSPVILSGDRHIAEIAKTTLPNGQDIYEVTSSGLTHTWKEWRPEPNRYRIAGDHVAELHYGLLSVDWAEKVMNISIKGANREEFTSLEIPF
ncbi:MAG TPA: alkaline phosphatase D family protein [Lunatimonas sp.]|nr:alkaline phosphatase D family protein [Lunatimonas sp.]